MYVCGITGSLGLWDHEKSLALARNFSTSSHITDQLTKELLFFFGIFVFIAFGGATRGGPPVLFPFTIFRFLFC